MSSMVNWIKESRTLKLLIVLLWVFIGSGLIYLMLRGEIVIPDTVKVLDSFSLRTYSLVIVMAVIVGALVFEYFRSKEPDLEELDIWEGLVYVVIPGVIGARVYHVLTDYSLYQDNLPAILEIWNGGVGVIGAVIGGAVGVYIFARRKGYRFSSLMGIGILVVPIAQAIGRLGNLVNRELYGFPTDLPWGLFIPDQERFLGLGEYSHYHPLFLYEAIGNLALFFLLYAFYLRGKRGWFLVQVYILGYGAIRFSLDFLRLEGISGVGMFSYAQLLIIALYTLLLGRIVVLKLSRSSGGDD